MPNTSMRWGLTVIVGVVFQFACGMIPADSSLVIKGEIRLDSVDEPLQPQCSLRLIRQRGNLEIGNVERVEAHGFAYRFRTAPGSHPYTVEIECEGVEGKFVYPFKTDSRMLELDLGTIDAARFALQTE